MPFMRLIMAQKFVSRAGWFLLVIFASTSAAVTSAQDRISGSELLLDRNGVQITVDDLVLYGKSLLGAERLDSGLNRPNAVLQLIENIYVIRRAAALAEAEDLLSRSEMRWQGSYAADRAGYTNWRDHRVEELLAAVSYEKLAEEVYAAEGHLFRAPDEVSVDHILIKADERTWQEVITRVDEIVSLLANGSDFNELALEYSDDTSAKANRGHLGFFSRGTMAPSFEAKAFAMTEPGEVSDPLISMFGVHIIRFNEAREGAQRSLEQMKLILDKRVRKEARAAAQDSATLPLKAELEDFWGEVDQEDLVSKVRSKL